MNESADTSTTFRKGDEVWAAISGAGYSIAGVIVSDVIPDVDGIRHGLGVMIDCTDYRGHHFQGWWKLTSLERRGGIVDKSPPAM